MSTATLEPVAAPGLLRKDYAPAEINFTPGERSFVAWITMDVVDNEGDVVVAQGVDFHSVFMGVPGDPTKAGNPVVMSIHDYKRWPLGTCEWIKLARPSPRMAFSGLYSKTLIDNDPDALKVFGMIQRRVVRGVSVGFRPPDDFDPREWGPPTKEELARRPDWKNARRIVRRCVLLEYSVVPIPMNQSSLIVAVSKGLELPSYLKGAVRQDDDMSDASKPGAPIIPGLHVKMPGGMCGTVKSLHEGEVPDVDDGGEKAIGRDGDPAARVELHTKGEDGACAPSGKFRGVMAKDLSPMDADDAEGVDGARDKGLNASSGTAGGYVVPPDDEVEKDAADGDADDMETEAMPEPEPAEEPIKKGDRVEWAAHKGMHAGYGVVKSVHTSGVVPGTLNHAEASEDDPHARVHVYKNMDHPMSFHPTKDHAAIATKRLKRLATMRVDGEAKGYGAKAIVGDAAGDVFVMHHPVPATKGIVAYKESPVVSGAWDAAAARARLKARAETGKDADGRPTYNMARYAEGFAWYDSAKPEDFGSYKLPIKDVRGGKLVCVKEAVSAALAALSGGRGGVDIPESDRAKVRANLERYRDRWADEPDGDGDADDAAKALPAPPAVKTRAQWEAEIERKLLATGRLDADAGAQANLIIQEVEDRLYGVIR